MEVKDGSSAARKCEVAPDVNEIVSMDGDFLESLLAEGDIFYFKLVPAWLIILLLIIGFFGNILNVLVYTRPFMRSQISLLLVSLKVVNLVLYTTHIPDLLQHFYRDFGSSYSGVVVGTFYPPTLTTLTGFSNWLTILIGIWGSVAVAFPLKVEKWCSRFRTKLAILMVAIFNALVASPQAFLSSFRRFAIFNETYNTNTNQAYSEIKPLYSMVASRFICEYPNLENVSLGLALLTNSIPCFILAVVIILLLVSLWQTKRNRINLTSGTYTAISSNRQIEWAKETRLVVLLVLLVFLYFLAYLPDSIYYIRILTITSLETLREEEFYKIVVSRIIVLAYNASTFFIHYAMSARFRQVLHSMIIPSRFRNDQVQDSALTMTSVTNN